MIDLTKGNPKPNWIKNYRIKTLKEFRQEFGKEFDDISDDSSWRDRVARHYSDGMDKYCGKSLDKLNIVRVLSDHHFNKASNSTCILLIKDDGDTWEISKPMLKPILNQKIRKLLKI